MTSSGKSKDTVLPAKSNELTLVFRFAKAVKKLPFPVMVIGLSAKKLVIPFPVIVNVGDLERAGKRIGEAREREANCRLGVWVLW